MLSRLSYAGPGGVNSFLDSVVSQVQGRGGTAGVAGIIGLVLARWSASGYGAAFMRSAHAIYDIDEGRPIWKTAPVQLTTLALVIMLLIAAAIVVLTGPIAKQVGGAFGIGSSAVLIWDIAKWPVLIILVSMMVTLLYKAIPT